MLPFWIALALFAQAPATPPAAPTLAPVWTVTEGMDANQVPIVPLYVHNTFQILPKGRWRLRRLPIRIRIGAPIPTAGLTLDDRETLRDRVRAAIEALRARVDSTAADP